MAYIRKLKNGTFQACIYKGRDLNGKMIREYITRQREKDCIAAARDIEIDVENQSLLNVSNMRFNIWADKWLEMKKPEIEDSTFISYKMYIETHFKPVFGKYKLSQINDLHVKDYLSKELSSHSSTSVRKYFGVLSNIFYTALKRKSPMLELKSPKVEKYTPCVPTEEQAALLHRCVKGTFDELPFLLAAHAGMREGEIFALTWADVDFNNSIIYIVKSRGITEEGYKNKKPKSERGIRRVVLPEYLVQLLKSKRPIDYKKSSAPIFNMRPDSYSGRWANLMDKLGTPEITFHNLRHYQATVMYRNGIPDQYAAQRLGHDVVVLKKIYQHLQSNDNKAMDDRMKDIFNEELAAANNAQNNAQNVSSGNNAIKTNLNTLRSAKIKRLNKPL